MLPNHVILEACVDSVRAAVQASQNGAHQLELCGRLDLDGLTPDIDLIKAVRAQVDIPIKVMLRNRGGNFVYSSDDISIMKDSLAELIQLDIQGIVFGALHEDDTINVELTQEICDLSGGIPITFHKAIDSSVDILSATYSLRSTGIQYILTSGGKPTAAEGSYLLKKMIKIAGPNIDIISAGKVTSDNIQELHKSIKGRSYHGKLIVGALDQYL